MKPTDWELIARHNAGDKKALDSIVHHYTPRLRSYLSQLLLQLEPDVRRATIDDVLQDVWSRVLRYSTRLDPQYKFSTWIFTVARNLALNEHRDRRRRPGRIPLISSPDTLLYEEVEVVDSHVSPDLLCENRDTLKKLAKYLREHTARSNIIVLELREVQGYSYGEIAKWIGIPVGTVKSRLHRARKAARRFRDTQ